MMKFTMEMPLRGEMSEPASLVAVARAAQDAGFALVGLTDHPAPSAKWLAAGGHPTLDPFVGLGFLAAATERIGLMTYLAVLPYRQPLLLAKSVASVDRLASGRLTLVVGTGYLKSEFAALGQSFDDRNARFDEALDVLRRVFTDDDFRYRGNGFEAHGVIHDPKPVQLPHPPIWIGGSSRLSRERVVRHGSGWAPLRSTPAFARTARTAAMAELGDLARAVRDLHRMLDDAGRDRRDVSIHVDLGSMERRPDEILDEVGQLAAIGVTHCLLRPPAGSVAAALEAVERFGSEVVARNPVGR